MRVCVVYVYYFLSLSLLPFFPTHTYRRLQRITSGTKSVAHAEHVRGKVDKSISSAVYHPTTIRSPVPPLSSTRVEPEATNNQSFPKMVCVCVCALGIASPRLSTSSPSSPSAKREAAPSPSPHTHTHASQGRREDCCCC